MGLVSGHGHAIAFLGGDESLPRGGDALFGRLNLQEALLDIKSGLVLKILVFLHQAADVFLRLLLCVIGLAPFKKSPLQPNLGVPLAGRVVISPVHQRIFTGADIIEVGSHLRIIRHRRERLVLLAQHHGLLGNAQVRPIPRRPLLTFVQGQGHGKIAQFSDVLHVRIHAFAQKRVQPRGHGGQIVFFGQHDLLGRGHIHLGLQHVELGPEPDLVKSRVHLELRPEPNKGVLSGANILSGLQDPQKSVLDGDRQLQFRIVDLGGDLLLLQDGLIMGGEQIETREQRLMHVEGKFPVVQRSRALTEGTRLLVKPGVAVLRAHGRAKSGLGRLDGVIRGQKRFPGGQDRRIGLEPDFHGVAHGQRFRRPGGNGKQSGHARAAYHQSFHKSSGTG